MPRGRALIPESQFPPRRMGGLHAPGQSLSEHPLDVPYEHPLEFRRLNLRINKMGTVVLTLHKIRKAFEGSVPGTEGESRPEVGGKSSTPTHHVECPPRLQ